MKVSTDEKQLETNQSQMELRFQSKLDQIRLIAEGGMSEIFIARQTSLNLQIILKQLKKSYVENNELIARFRREANALAKVLHQNVAHVYELIEQDQSYYILMEYIEGVDLSAAIRKTAPLPPEVAANITIGIARGLSAIHHHQLIHRDIKPSNIRINVRGEVKVMDFGIVANPDGSNLTQPGVLVGSPSYLSPEQIVGDAITPKSDLFMLGIVLYEMLTGARPFYDTGSRTVFQSIRSGEFTPVHKLRKDVPSALAELCHRCLSVDPKNRPKSADHVAAEIEKYLGPAQLSQSKSRLLGFLENEALIQSAPRFEVTLEEPSEIGSRPKLRQRWLRPAATILLGIAIGYGSSFLHQKLMSPKHPSPTAYQPAKPIR